MGALAAGTDRSPAFVRTAPVGGGSGSVEVVPLGGREAAFDAFARTSGPRLLRSAYLLTGNAATAQDLVQTALASTWTHWSRIREPAAAEAYARRCMVRTSATWWRRKWRGELPTAALPEGEGHSPYDAVDTAATVLAALRELDAKSRAVLVLRFLDDLSEADTAAALGMTVGTVKSRTSRALARLRAMDVWAELRP